MKICQLLHTLCTGGAEVLSDRIGRHLAAEHEVVFVCLDHVGELGEQLLEDGFQVHRLSRREGLDIGCMRRLSKWLRSERVDVVHAHQYTPFCYAAGCRVFGWSGPIVFTEHGRFVPDLPSRKRAVYNRLMLRRKDQIIAVGNHVKSALIDNESLPGDRIQVIYNGVDLEPFDELPIDTDRVRFRREFGVPDDAFLISQVARLDYLKDHTTAVAAVAGIPSNQNVHLLLVGEGPERAKVESAIQEHGVVDRVHLLGLRRDVPTILLASDMLMLTSISEGIPLTLIEGMAAGLPCVSTNVGGVGEVINAETGILTPSQDVEALCSAIIRLRNDSDLRIAMGESGRTHAKRQFSENQMMNSYQRVFASL